RCVTRDDLVALAVRETAAKLAVEDAKLRREALGLRTTVELLADPLCDRRVPDRIEPNVRILRLARCEEVHRVRVRRVDRVLECRLEVLSEVEDEVGVGDGADVAAGELEVVRLDPR